MIYSPVEIVQRDVYLQGVVCDVVADELVASRSAEVRCLCHGADRDAAAEHGPRVLPADTSSAPGHPLRGKCAQVLAGLVLLDSHHSR